MTQSISTDRRAVLTRTSVALVLSLAAACSDSTSPSSQQSFEATASADLAPSAGEDVATDYSFYAGASATAVGGSFSQNTAAGTSGISASLNVPTHAAATWISSACTYNSTTQYFDCPPVTRLWHTFTVSYGLFDASNVNQSAYDNVTTASINFIIADTGAVLWTQFGNTFADTSGRHRDATVSNLQGSPDTVHIWNGHGTSAIHSVRSGQITKRFVFTSNDTTTDLRFRLPRDINPYPLSGTIVRSYTITRTREASDTTTRTTTRRVVVTFDGTANASMLVGTDQYILNLDTHRVTKQP